jgi:hypothetical protein
MCVCVCVCVCVQDIICKSYKINVFNISRKFLLISHVTNKVPLLQLRNMWNSDLEPFFCVCVCVCVCVRAFQTR